MKLLNLGCGATRPGEPWTNLDNLNETLLPGTPERANLDAEMNYVNHDIRKPLPFEDNAFDGVLMSHVLEHFDCQEGVSILRECRRVLKEGGDIIVSVPDAEWLLKNLPIDTVDNAVEMYGEPIHPDDGETTFFGYALWNRFHKAILTEDSLRCYFIRAGFAWAERFKLLNYGWRNGSPIKPMESLLNRLKFSLVMSGIK